MNAEEFQKHLKMMQTPDDWPQVALPLVRRQGNGKLPDAAFMVAFGGKPEPKIYLGNIFEIPQGFVSRRDLEDKFEVERFEDFEGVLDAGWVVD